MGMKQVFEENPDRRYIMFGGKGGLGKTTFSAATAYWLAKQGKKVLVFSVDPQACLSDIFQRDIFGKGRSRSWTTCGPRKSTPTSISRTTSRRSGRRSSTCTVSKPCPTRSSTTSRLPPPNRPWRRARSSTPWWTSLSRETTTTTSTTSSRSGTPSTTSQHGQGLRRVDQQDHEAPRGHARVRGDGQSRLKREKETEEDEILKELQYIKERINASSSDPDRQGKDGFLLRRHS